MKKFILLLFCFCSISMYAKTRYVAFNDISFNIEMYDSLNHPTYEHLFTHEEYLIKNVGDIQVTAYSIPVSDQENKAIKSAKAAAGWSAAAMIVSAASAVTSAVSSTSHHHYGHGHFHRHNWWYHEDRLLLSSMNLMFSAALHQNAVKALNDLQNFEGTAIVVSNNALDVKTVIVNHVQYYIGPKDTKAFTLGKDGAVVIIKDMNGVTKIIANATRTVKKIPYSFSDEDFYYRKVKVEGETIYQQLPKTNIQAPVFISKGEFEGYRKHIKK